MVLWPHNIKEESAKLDQKSNSFFKADRITELYGLLKKKAAFHYTSQENNCNSDIIKAL